MEELLNWMEYIEDVRQARKSTSQAKKTYWSLSYLQR